MHNIFHKQKVFIIAEAGVNHDGKLNQAFRLIDVARAANVDAVKFQTFKQGECTGKFSPRYNMSSSLVLPHGDFKKLKSYCEKKHILFLTTPDGMESLEYVNSVLNVPAIKISSTDVTHLKFLEEVAKKQKPIIFSTGMSTLDEVGRALEVMKKYNDDITVLHCTSQYPALPEEANLRAMVTIKKNFGVRVGYSDHTLGVEASIAAVALGASVIEKHFTIDQRLPGPDHKASLSPVGLKEFVSAIRKTEKMLGNGEKQPSESEKKDIVDIRRSIVAAKDLEPGNCLCSEDLTFKRPATGIHPYDFEKVLKKKINKKLQKDEPLMWKYLEG